MAEQAIQGINPNIGAQAEAVAGNQAISFTATDRKIIEERGGEVNRNRSFIDVLKNKPLNTKVENEQTSVKPEIDIKELEGRVREHKQMLKHSVHHVPEERVEITNTPPDNYEEQKKVVATPSKEDKAEIDTHKKTVAIVKELNLDPTKIIDKFKLEQNQLLNLVSRIKELHLKRLLTEDQKEFESISARIIKETISVARSEAKDWLTGQLNKLAKNAAEYKLKLEKSMQAVDYSKQREEIIKWLEKSTAKLS
jgi:hypothetical protein